MREHLEFRGFRAALNELAISLAKRPPSATAGRAFGIGRSRAAAGGSGFKRTAAGEP